MGMKVNYLTCTD